MAQVRHRGDIDGLRAIAVLPVIAYHLGLPLARGGFVGVDVFFVISGYLIGTIILTETDDGRFSFLRFYERRIRRIFPALFVMLAVCTAAFAALDPPEMLEGYALSLVASVFSASNIYFWTHSGYFGAAAATEPLLHTWSLGIEEQFYLIAPAALVLLSRFGPGPRRIAVAAAAAVSLALAAVIAVVQSHTAFYLLHTRAWELLLGVLLPLGLFPRLWRPLTRELAAAGGVAMIAGSVVWLHNGVPFPGLAALPACLGAALVLRAGEAGGSFAGGLISLPPLRFVGLISYSLYLWHWPLIVFQRISGITAPGGSPLMTGAAILVLTFALATLSWRYVERPVREGRNWLPRPALFKTAAALTAVASLTGVSFAATGGLPYRFGPTNRELLSYLGGRIGAPDRAGVCFLADGDRISGFSPEVCLKRSAARANYLLIGDSHAAVMWHGLAAALPQANVMQATTVGCRPVLPSPRDSPRCRRVFGEVFDDFLPHSRVDELVIEGQWSEHDLPALSRTLDWTRERRIPTLLLGPTPQYDSDLPWLLVRLHQDPALVARHQIPGQGRLDRELASLAAEKGARYVSLLQALCSKGQCATEVRRGVPMEFDNHHLTVEGSDAVAKRLRQLGELP
jgi:peptidoglycan/LPS O-acetylase OafA/YrhL